MSNFKSISFKMAVLQGGGQNLPSPCVCYPKDLMWNRVKSHYLQENLKMLDFEEGNNNSYNQGQIKDKTFRCEPEDPSRVHVQRV